MKFLMVVQAIGPTVVAIVIGSIAAGIAYRQWKTAHQKLMIDMFDRRSNFLEEMRQVVKGFLTRRDVNEAVFALADMKQRSRYLFGYKVTAFFDEIITDIEAADILDADSDEAGTKSVDASASLRDFNLRAYAAFGPYMSLAHVVSPPSR